LKCEYNRDGDSWRSPFSNQYYPLLDPEIDSEAFRPTGNLLALEKTSNELLREYAKLYYGDPLTSAYFFETNESGFGACFLIKNELNQVKGVDASIWDSINSFTVEIDGSDYKYTLVSTVFLHIKWGDNKSGKINLAGTSSKTIERTFKSLKSEKEHIERMGTMLEENEQDL